MASIVTTSPQTRSTSRPCGPRRGLDGILLLIQSNQFIPESFRSCESMSNFTILPCQRFTKFGGAVPHRPVEDLAFAVARFIQKGGSFVNYYMVRILVQMLVKDRIGCSSLKEGKGELGNLKFRPIAPTKLHNIKLKHAIYMCN